jgi:formylglycine-generating enzyme required for sulfatase activity
VRIGYAFAVGKYPVTVGEFRRFIEAAGHDTGQSAFVWTVSDWEDRPGGGWRNPGFAQDDRHPVTCVSWDDAQAYVAWAARQTAAPYRLLSEAEWGRVRRRERGCAFQRGTDDPVRSAVSVTDLAYRCVCNVPMRTGPPVRRCLPSRR